MKVLVTGGSGIVGHYVIDELYKNGHTVINADVARMSTNLGHSGNDRHRQWRGSGEDAGELAAVTEVL